MLRLSACAVAFLALCGAAQAAEPAHPKSLDDMIISQAKRHGVPEKLVRRIVMRESKYNPRARNHAFWGLMQISYPTAKSMGFKGSPTDLLDPLVNLTYAVPYLANAFAIAGQQEDAAVRLYASGYYQTAKNRRMLGDLRTADSDPVSPAERFLVATAKPVTTLLTAVANVPNAQQIIEAAPPVTSASAQQVGQGGGPDLAPEVMMSAGKSGYAPPKKWTKDGGVTVIARGEQRIDAVAAYAAASGAIAKQSAKAKLAAAHGKTKKNTDYALLDPPAANGQPATASDAQAYAAPLPRDASVQTATAPQAAIASVTSDGRAPIQEKGSASLDGADDEAKPAKAAHSSHKVAKKGETKDVKVASKGSSSKTVTGELRTSDANDDVDAATIVKKTPAKAKAVHVASKKAAPHDVDLAKSEDPTPAPAAK